jgi:hypothetical protein
MLAPIAEETDEEEYRNDDGGAEQEIVANAA